MRKLFIIGNGFDLAHGLKTRYSDFFIWLFKKQVTKFLINSERKEPIDEFFWFSNRKGINEELMYKKVRKVVLKEDCSLEDILNLCSTNSVLDLKCKEIFINRSQECLWADIEDQILIQSDRVLTKSYQFNISNEKLIKSLGDSIGLFKKYLDEYISQIGSKIEINKVKHNYFEQLFVDEFRVVNFNYTKTVERYTDKENIINIHGQVSDKTDTIVFGNGNINSREFQKIKKDKLKEDLLSHFKLYSYQYSDNYENVLDYINQSNYEVHIIGHSCAASDTIMLNEVFNHGNCNDIKIYYHEDISNYKSVSVAVSRIVAEDLYNKKVKHCSKCLIIDS